MKTLLFLFALLATVVAQYEQITVEGTLIGRYSEHYNCDVEKYGVIRMEYIKVNYTFSFYYNKTTYYATSCYSKSHASCNYGIKWDNLEYRSTVNIDCSGGCCPVFMNNLTEYQSIQIGDTLIFNVSLENMNEFYLDKLPSQNQPLSEQKSVISEENRKKLALACIAFTASIALFMSCVICFTNKMEKEEITQKAETNRKKVKFGPEKPKPEETKENDKKED